MITMAAKQKCKHDEYGCVTEFDKFIAIKK